MNSLNSILLEGNVVRDPVVKETPRGTTVCNFSIAANRSFKQDDELERETSFFEVESWAKLADACGKYCLKGKGVRVVGRLKQDRWTGPDGKNYSKIKVVAEHVEFKPSFKNNSLPGGDSPKPETSAFVQEEQDVLDEGFQKLAAGAEHDTFTAEETAVF